MATLDDILGFWFGRPGEPDYGSEREVWWEATPAFDAEVKRRFEAHYAAALAGARDHWKDDARACLSLILTFDQFPRNMYRGNPKAYATDGEALALARHAVARGFDSALLPVERWFVYMPFPHSERIEDQRRSVALFRALSGDPGSAKSIRSAERHFEIIERFGRFPHRNAMLGRKTSPEEAKFLEEPESSF